MPDATTNGYVPVPGDTRIVRHYAATEAIATSSGQNDAGVFELNFRDERYLPFEFGGAVSRWRIELPQENNQFDMDTLSDVILHMNYTAREGGTVLRDAANEAAQAHLPDNGRRVFDLKREMPDAWNKFLHRGDHHHHQRFDLDLSRGMFPYVMANREVTITRMDLFIAAEGAHPSTHREVEFIVAHKKGCPRADADEHEFECSASSALPGFFHGSVDVRVGPLQRSNVRHVGTFVFEEPLEDIARAFLLVHYEVR